MIKFIKTKNTIGIQILRIFQITIGKDIGVLIDTINVQINIYKIIISLCIGKEKKDGERIKQSIKESKNHDAFA
jgi:hypothetical protein|tara:strand:+ start:7590 stop:7811 length:222 start_codon:yes stop_codon:yes gene_type:complete